MRTRDKEMLRRNAERGVQYLNENPELGDAFEYWYTTIKTNTLDMSVGSRCMLGQLTGSYTSGVMELTGLEPDSVEARRWAAQHGFYVQDRTVKGKFPRRPIVNYDWRDEAYQYLTQLWQDAILNEQLERSLAPVPSPTS